MNPTAISDVASLVLDCVCSQMDALDGADGVPEGYACPCLAYVSAGEPSVDCCSSSCDDPGGMLTVHVEAVYPSDIFPSTSENFEPCKAATWVASVVVTAARCAPTTDEEGNLASIDDLQAAALIMAVDQYAVLTALSCCVANDPPAGKRKRRVLITDTRPLVSEGGCSSIEVRAAVEIARVCACAEESS